jgi:tetratricopeptide (TPR) repeat protein
MSDATPIPEDSLEPPDRPSSSPKPPLLADPVVRILAYASLGLVILFVATVIGVIGTGVIAPTGPRSVAERQLLITSAQVGTTGAASAPYINALVAAGDLTAARVALSQARGSVSATESVSDLDLAEARLLSADAQYENAVTLADKAIKGYKAKHDALVAKAGTTANTARIGYGEDYYNASLVKAYALVALGRWKDAVTAFDLYMSVNPTASDILIDRGNAKVELKDKAGAEKDFREALRFVPYDEEAKAGLKKIGVAQ